MPTAQRGRFGAQSGGNAGDLREVNLTRILGYVRDHGTSSRHDIAAGVGLGISTMTDLIGELRARRLLLELPPVRRPTAGRPTRPIAIDGEPWLVLGIHVDVDAVELNGANLAGTTLWSAKVDVDGRGTDGLTAVLDVVQSQVRQLPADRRLSTVEVAVPGTVEPSTGAVRSSVALDWEDVALADLIGVRLQAAGLSPGRPDDVGVQVGVTNDTQLAGLHAARVELALPPTSVAVYLGGMRTLAGAVLIDGEIFSGSGGNAGGLGHLNVDPSGEQCWCGRTGCLETFAGLRWILQRGGLRSAQEAAELAATHPRQAAAVVLQALAEGHTEVREALDQAAYGLSRAVDDVVAQLNPDTVVLGGQLGLLGDCLGPAVLERLGARLARGQLDLDPLVWVGDAGPRAVLGATLAARDAVLADPLRLTDVLD